MSRVYANPIDTKHSEVVFEHEFLTVLRGRNLSVDVEELYNVGTINNGSDNSGYVAAVVTHLTDPLEDVDVSEAERVETTICGCPGWYHHCYDEQIGAVLSDCKHTEEIRRQRRTDRDEAQKTLV